VARAQADPFLGTKIPAIRHQRQCLLHRYFSIILSLP
jgi:hypothetical protein